MVLQVFTDRPYTCKLGVEGVSGYSFCLSTKPCVHLLFSLRRTCDSKYGEGLDMVILMRNRERNKMMLHLGKSLDTILAFLDFCGVCETAGEEQECKIRLSHTVCA